MDLPLMCLCGRETMVDLESMPRRNITKILQVEGFYCGVCGAWNDYFLITPSLSEQMVKLSRISVTHRNYPYYFAKAVRKASGIQKRTGDHG